MKTLPLLIVTFFMLASSCGIHIEKRLYRDGFYVSVPHEHSRSASEPTSADAIVAEHSPDNIDTIRLPLAEHSLQTAELSRDTTEHTPAVSNFSLPLITTPPVLAEDTAYTETPGEEIASIAKLQKNASAFLKSSLLVFPLAFLTLFIAFILSLVMLAKIRKLRSATLNEQEQSELQRYRRSAIKILVISLLCMTAILAAAVLLFMSVPLSPLGGIAAPF
jgi:hypothetical protein